MPNAFPSGEQIEIRAGDRRVVVVEVGAGLRSYTVGGKDILDGYNVEEMARSGRGQVLVPWPNRIQDGTYAFGGTQQQLPLNELGARNAIHGLVRWASWTTAEREDDRVVLWDTAARRVDASIDLALRLEYALSERGLRVTTTATNVGREACPYGSGMHPYLTLGTETVDSLELCAPGRTMLRTDDRGIPVDSEPVEGTVYDFGKAKPIGPTTLDHAFTDLERGADGLARVELTDPELEATLSLWVDESYPYLQLFTGDPIPDVARRSLAVEPMTCPPNALQTGESLIVLAPEESTTSNWGLEGGTT